MPVPPLLTVGPAQTKPSTPHLTSEPKASKKRAQSPQSWVNEGHDVTTADEMKVALASHGGVRGCRFAVVEIDKVC